MRGYKKVNKMERVAKGVVTRRKGRETIEKGNNFPN